MIVTLVTFVVAKVMLRAQQNQFSVLVDALCETSLRTIHIQGSSPIEHNPSLLPDAATLLDYNAGTGRTVAESYRLLGLQNKIEYFGYSKRHGIHWTAQTPDGWTIHRIASKERVLNVAGTTDILHVSHALHDYSALKDLTKVVQKLRPGAIVIVRGVGPNSILSLLSRLMSHQGFRSAFCPDYHRWDLTFLSFLMRSGNLENCIVDQVDHSISSKRKSIGSPAFLIRQEFDINPQSIAGLSQSLEIKFGKRMADQALKHLRYMWNLSLLIPTARHLEQDDIVYLLRKKEGEPDVDCETINRPMERGVQHSPSAYPL